MTDLFTESTVQSTELQYTQEATTPARPTARPVYPTRPAYPTYPPSPRPPTRLRSGQYTK